MQYKTNTQKIQTDKHKYQTIQHLLTQ